MTRQAEKQKQDGDGTHTIQDVSSVSETALRVDRKLLYVNFLVMSG
jgi:hypothetical protein